MPPKVRRASTGDLKPAARVLAAAFDTYPWTRWSIPEAGYAQRLERLQYLYLGYTLAHGLLLVDQRLRAVAAFIPPGAPEPASDMLNEVAELHGARLGALADLALPQPAAPAWNLATVGVDPAHQGAGLGTGITSAGLAFIDQEAGAVALETSDERNVSLYRRLGFVITATTDIPDGPTVYSMSRAPRSPEPSPGQGISRWTP